MKQIKDYSNYFITEFGDVYSNKPSGLKKLSLKLDKDGYYVVLSKKGIRKFYRINRLVAERYIPNPNNLPQVDHKDCNKLNNSVSNLEWVTRKENMNRAKKNGLLKSGEKHGQAKLTNEQIKWIRNHYIYKHDEFGSTSLGKKFNVCHATILRIIKNQRYVEK
jgi:hypothetical protein